MYETAIGGRQSTPSRYHHVKTHAVVCAGDTDGTFPCQGFFKRETMAPRMRKKLKTLGLKEGDKLTYKCEARAHPRPEYRWYRDGVLLKKGKGIRIKMGKRTSRLQINKVKLSHEGEYSCEAFNFLGTDEVKGKVTVSKCGEMLMGQPYIYYILDKNVRTHHSTFTQIARTS
uniref:Ig-like domain-containing protein n=1 Tax=Eptatretus burgeri TaxID=7764 RepID=A0A8C4N5R6_EPTBU